MFDSEKVLNAFQAAFEKAVDNAADNDYYTCTDDYISGNFTFGRHEFYFSINNKGELEVEDNYVGNHDNVLNWLIESADDMCGAYERAHDNYLDSFLTETERIFGSEAAYWHYRNG